MSASEEIHILFSRESAAVLDVAYINAMMNGYDGSTKIDIVFLKDDKPVLNADVQMGASSFDLRDFAVAEALYQYKARTGENAPDYTHIQIGPHRFEADYFSPEPELWKSSLDSRKHVNRSDYMISIWLSCGEGLLNDFKHAGISHQEFKSAARKAYMPLHAAYLCRTCDVKLADGQGNHIGYRSKVSRSFKRLQNRFLTRRV